MTERATPPQSFQEIILRLARPNVKTARSACAVRRIAEKWLGYYWPIFASNRFVPQSQSEGAGSTKPVMFRKAVATLMAPYCSSGEHGGLSAWQLDLSGGRLDPQTRAHLQDALRAIAHAIRQGPVQFAGGALETGTVFSFDAVQPQVLMSADLWRELSLLGHWIHDAVILRWAELTERFGQRQGIRSSDVLPCCWPGRSPSVPRTSREKSFGITTSTDAPGPTDASPTTLPSTM